MDGLCVAALQGRGQALYAVVVCGALFGGRRKRGCEESQEVKERLAEASVCFEDNWCDRVRVVLGTFVEFGELAGVAGCDSGVRGTRHGSSSCGGGDHDVKVEGLVRSEKGDVGPVEFAVVVGMLIASWVRGDDLLGEG